MECRICLETGALLKDICKCKGTTGAIHLKCLQRMVYHSGSYICGVCKHPYDMYKQKKIKKPKLWNYINTPVFEFCIRLFLINILKLGSTLPFEIAHWVNIGLIFFYVYCYCDVILDSMSMEVLKLWGNLFFKYKEEYYFPLVLLIYLAICFVQPLVMIVFYPYNRIYEIHKRIKILTS